MMGGKKRGLGGRQRGSEEGKEGGNAESEG
jgi:hypothetical protein